MKILMVEDDIHLCEILSFELEEQGYMVTVCNNGEEALHNILIKAYDLILLDQMLPSMEGKEVLKLMRRENIQTPVIFLTALGEYEDRIKGLDLGADDYIVKPFHTGELMARIRSISRRSVGIINTEQLVYGDIRYYIEEKKLEFQGKVEILSQREGELLELFLKNTEKILSRQQIFSRIWGKLAEVEDGNLDNYIYLLRKKLAAVGSRIEISTIRRVGYQLTYKERE